MDHSSIFSAMQAELPGYEAAAIGKLQGGVQFHREGRHGLDDLGPALTELIQAHHKAYEGLGGRVDFGSDDELLLSASRGSLVVRLDHQKGAFIAVQLGSSGNLGYLRYRMRGWLKALAA
jgi:hypothetical protein